MLALGATVGVSLGSYGGCMLALGATVGVSLGS